MADLRRKARATYQDFLTLWKDADPDIPIYKQAKAEYTNLCKAIVSALRICRNARRVALRRACGLDWASFRGSSR